MKFEEMKEEELKETLELVKRVFDEFEHQIIQAKE